MYLGINPIPEPVATLTAGQGVLACSVDGCRVTVQHGLAGLEAHGRVVHPGVPARAMLPEGAPS
jgi:hypothetical protein